MSELVVKARRKWALLALFMSSVAALKTAHAASSYGCIFDKTVCTDTEICVDDGVFGVCRGPGDPPEWSSTSRTEASARLLESELGRLWAEGYRWSDDYTQCVVRQLLEGARQGAAFYDPGYCAHALRLSLPEISEQVAEQLSSIDPADQASIRFTPDLPLEEGTSGNPRGRPSADAIGTFADEVFVPPTASAANHDPERELRRLEADQSRLFPRNTITSEGREGDGLIFQQDDRSGLILQDNEQQRPNEDEILDEGQWQDNLAQDIQENLWRAQNPGLDDAATRRTLPMLDDEVVDLNIGDDRDIYEYLPRPIEKRGRRLEPPIVWEDDSYKATPSDKATEDSDLQLVLDVLQRLPAYQQDARLREFEDQPKEDLIERWDDRTPIGEGSSLENANLLPPESALADGPQETENSDADTPLDMYMAVAPDNSDFVGNLRIRADPFYRPMRLDTKKPGPNYIFHEREDGQDEQEYRKNMLRLERKMHMLTSKNYVDGSDLIEALNDIDQNGQKREVEVVGVPPSRIPERHAAGVAPLDPYNTERGVEAVDSNTAYLIVRNIHTGEVNHADARSLTTTLEKIFGLPTGTISQLRLNGSQVAFKLLPNEKGLNASEMIRLIDGKSDDILHATNLSIASAGIGERVKYELISPKSSDLFLFTFVVCGSVVGVLLAISVIYIVRRHQLSRDKLHGLNGEDDPLAKFDYQDLCRQRMADTNTGGKESALAAAMEAGRGPEKGSPKKVKIASQHSHDSSRSSTSSWSEEPVASNMDISTGHMILSYMEDHLKSKNRLDEEWESLCAYETDPCSTAVAEKNAKKNRYAYALPYDHSRVVLNEFSNADGSDYINASAITDHDPRNPAYIATQGPLPHTAADFWQMVWEQGSVVIVTLTRLMENGVAMCHRYWPEEGSEVYALYEVHLVSEHIWCDDYLVRSFYLKNLNTSETRTVTQFHFLSWPEAGVPPSAKALLDFRRKVNKSYRGRSCPIIVHCSDGSGRAGTYILADMVLNRIAKGAKEINVAATLEHVRDQRAKMVRTKAQFEFVLMAIAEEVHAILKALSKE